MHIHNTNNVIDFLVLNRQKIQKKNYRMLYVTPYVKMVLIIVLIISENNLYINAVATDLRIIIPKATMSLRFKHSKTKRKKNIFKKGYGQDLFSKKRELERNQIICKQKLLIWI